MCWLDGKTLGKIRIRRLLIRNSRVKVYRQISKINSVKIFVKYVNAHQKAPIPKEMTNYI